MEENWLNRKPAGLILLVAIFGILNSHAVIAQERTEAPYCARNPFNRDAAEPLPIGLTDWHCDHCRPYEFERAGMPQTIRPHAQLASPHFWGYWVGGGTAIGGGPPCADEGTWGWDFEGYPSRRIWLNWSHGRRYQGGTGAYKTDGPKLHLHH